MKRSFRSILIISPIIIFAGIIVILFLTKEKAPVEEIKKAREKLSEAKAANAQLYSKKLYTNACMSYDSAMFYWNIENNKFFLFRKYNKVKSFAYRAEMLAASSIENSGSYSKNIKKEVEQKIASVQKKIDIYQEYFKNIPQVDDVRKQYNKGKILFGEAKLASEKSDFVKAKQKIDLSSTLIQTSYNEVNRILVEYFKDFQKWKKWSDKAIENSGKEGTTCLIIDKFARVCLLYKNGILKGKFDIDLGRNWIGTKNHQGDYMTPEGVYKIIDKKEKGRTNFYKALLINYPNDEDKARFVLNKKNGNIPSRKRIGDLVEIHGLGGKGADWTQGCIALSNNDIDIIYSKCPVGTNVTIVGSLKPLDQIMKLP